MLCTRAAFAHNPQAGLCKAHAAYGLSIAAAAAAVVTAATVVISATAADKDYKNDNPQTTIVSASVTKHIFAPPILCSLYHTSIFGFGYSK